MRVTKRRLLVISVLLFAGMSQSHAERDANYVHKDREILSTGEKMVLDAVVLRPIGMATTVVGSAVYVISLPFSLLGGNEAEVREHLVNEPARYTFKRPLGDVEY
jgi:hypothetical protein